MTDCGVYRITCVPSGRVYIGSSLSVRKRFGEHKTALRYNRHHSLLFQRAWNKHGEGAFVFAPILWCAPKDRHFYEQRAIDAYRAADPSTGMNRSAVAVGSPPPASFKGRRHTEESRRLISRRLKGRKVWNKGLPSPNRGVARSEEVRAAIREAKRANSGSITMETARAIRAERAATKKSAQKLAEQFGASKSVVYRVLRNTAWVEAT